MPVYTYRGVNRAGATVVGERSATSKTEAATILKRLPSAAAITVSSPPVDQSTKVALLPPWNRGGLSMHPRTVSIGIKASSSSLVNSARYFWRNCGECSPHICRSISIDVCEMCGHSELFTRTHAQKLRNVVRHE